MRNSKLCACTLGLFASSGLAGEVLYDSTLDTSLPGVYSNVFGVRAFIGGEQVFGLALDSQFADDIQLDTAHRITRFTVDLGTIVGLPPNEIMVEIFEDAGGVPSDTASVSFVTSEYTVVEQFQIESELVAYRIAVDMSGMDIVLDEGVWWFSMIGINGEDSTYAFFESTLPSDPPPLRLGFHHVGRDGGVAHANGLPGLYGSNDWFKPFEAVGANNPNIEANPAMRIEGESITCAADLAQPFGTLNFFDIGEFLTRFNAQDPSVDFQPDGILNFFDLAEFLTLFNAGCP